MDGLFDGLVALILVGIVAGGLIVTLGTVVGRVTIHDYERGVRMDGGTVVGLVGPGPIVYLKPRTEIVVIDTRPVAQAVDGIADAVVVEVWEHHRVGDLDALYQSMALARPGAQDAGSSCGLSPLFANERGQYIHAPGACRKSAPFRYDPSRPPPKSPAFSPHPDMAHTLQNHSRDRARSRFKGVSPLA